MKTLEHWQHVYTTKAADTVSWFQQHAATSLSLIQAIDVGKQAAIIDVGGGASTLVDDLLLDGYTNLTVLDLAAAALEVSQTRIGTAAKNVHWLAADITEIDLPQHKFDLWHDRAVFHFLTEAEQRMAYIKTLLHAVKPQGHIILATFALDGPTKCSGLPVVQYSAESLQAELGENFMLINQFAQTHKTPFATTQNFIYCHFINNLL